MCFLKDFLTSLFFLSIYFAVHNLPFFHYNNIKTLCFQIPSMDSPGVKTTYTAIVKAPEWCTVLMSALADDVAADGSKYKDPKGVFRWKQPVPTSAYLVALAAGQLSFRDIRSVTLKNIPTIPISILTISFCDDYMCNF